MKIEFNDVAISTIAADAVAVGIWKDEPLNGPAKQLCLLYTSDAADE